jgi:hypothetical protein
VNPSPTPLHLLNVGDMITPRFFINNDRINDWKFATECDDVGGGMIAHTARLKVVQISKLKQNEWPWVKVEMVGFDPPRFLKISGEEYISCFVTA